jgi:hypothetical protein
VIHLVDATVVRVDLLTGSGETLDGQFLESFANPVEARGGADILKWEDEKNAFLRQGSASHRPAG